MRNCPQDNINIVFRFQSGPVFVLMFLNPSSGSQKMTFLPKGELAGMAVSEDLMS